MAINQGLKTLVESTPNFSNQGVQNLIAPVNIGWVLKTRTWHKRQMPAPCLQSVKKMICMIH